MVQNGTRKEIRASYEQRTYNIIDADRDWRKIDRKLMWYISITGSHHVPARRHIASSIAPVHYQTVYDPRRQSTACLPPICLTSWRPGSHAGTCFELAARFIPHHYVQDFFVADKCAVCRRICGRYFCQRLSLCPDHQASDRRRYGSAPLLIGWITWHVSHLLFI